MLQKINHFLSPIERIIGKYRVYIGYTFIVLSFFSLSLIFFPSFVKDTGEQAKNLLFFLLFLPIFSRVLWLSLAQSIMPLRKEIGIFMGTLAFVHGAAYIYEYPSFILDIEFWWQEGMVTYFFLWFVSLIFTIPLVLTSNNWAIKKLWKKWKLLHRTVYLIAIFTILHVVLLEWTTQWRIEYGQFILLVIYFIGKWLEWKGIGLKKQAQYKKWQKWFCIPCGFIYDPALWDEDSGIAPGTEFVDIPKDWKCPICWVTKADFVLYKEGKEASSYTAKIVEKTLLNPTTLELVIEVTENWKSIPWQFMTFFWQDNEWLFSRMYSIAEQNGKRYSFTIKLTEKWRGALILQSLKIGDEVNIGWIHGSFTLKDTKNPKIFIASGTGLAPIYHMLKSIPKTINKTLYFSVSTAAELFYIEKLQQIPWLDLHIHVTREEIDGYEKWRIDVANIQAEKNTEWYICWNPNMVSDAKNKLHDSGYDMVYSEEFN